MSKISKWEKYLFLGRSVLPAGDCTNCTFTESPDFLPGSFLKLKDTYYYIIKKLIN